MKPTSIHGTAEWAVSNVNIEAGCEHNCRYCYAKAMAIRFRRATATSWNTPVPRETLPKVKTFRGTVMFPSSHDITPRNLDACIRVLKELLAAGTQVLIVSKPHIECVGRLCCEIKPFRGQAMFRFTIGATHDTVLSYWEPGAPQFQERLAALELAHRQGYRTSVSCEPMLDDKVEALIHKVSPHVTDTIWLGRANRLRQTLSLNCPNDLQVMYAGQHLVDLWCDEAVKKLYKAVGKNPQIRWKDSLKTVLGMDRPTKKGLDV